MNNSATLAETRDIVVDEIFPNSQQAIWKALTTGELMARWLMDPTGFQPVKGTRFTYQTTAAGKWDGTIHCEVLEAVPNERLTYSWVGGDETNEGYGSRLETVVTFDLSHAEGGTRLRLTHSGFRLPHNNSAFENMSKGWPKVIRNIDQIAGEIG